MAGINRCEFWGMITKPELKELNGGFTVQNFTLLVKGAEYDKAARADVVKETWISCERFMPDDFTQQDEVFQGDYAHVIAEYTQQEGRDGQKHSRFRVLVLTVTRRGRNFGNREAGNAPAAQPAAQQQAPLSRDQDPWAVQ